MKHIKTYNEKFQTDNKYINFISEKERIDNFNLKLNSL